MKKVAVISGNGVGPEVITATTRILKVMGTSIELVPCEVGYIPWRKTGKPIPEEAWDSLKDSDAILKGPTQTPVGVETFKSVVVTLRKAFELYACVRPVKTRPGIPSLHGDVDFVIIRENTEDLYSGLEEELEDESRAIRVITRKASERIAKFAFEYASKTSRRKVTVVHKATVLPKTCGLFREVCLKVAAQWPGIIVDEAVVDTAAYKMVTSPQSFDVIVTTNMFGDILSDVGAAVAGGLGLSPSANIGDTKGMFEPVHGTANDIAGKNIVNPTATILSACMMLQYFNYEKESLRLGKALDQVLVDRSNCTPDIGGRGTTTTMTQAIINRLAQDK